MPRRSPFACSAQPNRARQVLGIARDTATDRPNSCAPTGQPQELLCRPFIIFLLSQGKVNVDRRPSRVKILIDDISAETRLKNAGVRGESLTSYRMAVQPGLFDSDERLQARRAIYWNGCRL